MSAEIVTLPVAWVERPPATTMEALRGELASFIQAYPFEDISDQFQRGMLSGLMAAYEIAGFDRGDARYQAGRRLLDRMYAACEGIGG
jgi:hypothetical protein